MMRVIVGGVVLLLVGVGCTTVVPVKESTDENLTQRVNELERRLNAVEARQGVAPQR